MVSTGEMWVLTRTASRSHINFHLYVKMKINLYSIGPHATTYLVHPTVHFGCVNCLRNSDLVEKSAQNFVKNWKPTSCHFRRSKHAVRKREKGPASIFVKPTTGRKFGK